MNAGEQNIFVGILAVIGLILALAVLIPPKRDKDRQNYKASNIIMDSLLITSILGLAVVVLVVAIKDASAVESFAGKELHNDVDVQVLVSELEEELRQGYPKPADDDEDD